MSVDFWGTPLSSERSHRSYRPLSTLSLRLTALVSVEPALFHATNAILHGVATWLVHSLASASLRGRSAPLGAALLHAVHPANTEAVAYCTGRADLLAAVFGLSGVRLYDLAVDTAMNGKHLAAHSYWLCSAGCLMLALACKETALVLLPACMAGDVLRFILAASPQRSPSPNGMGQAARRMAHGWVLLACVTLGFVWLRMCHAGRLANQFRRLDNPIAFLPTATDRALGCARIHLVSFGLLLWPARLSADYSHDALSLSHASLRSSALGIGVQAALLYAALLCSGAWLLTRACTPAPRPYAARCHDLSRLRWLLLMLLLYAPASHSLLPLSFVVAERLLYMPAIAACVLVHACMQSARRPSIGRLWARRAFMAVALTCGGSRTMRRGIDWVDDQTLFEAAALAYPRSAKTVYQVADGLVRRNRADEAVPLLELALEIEPNYHYAYLHLSRLALRRGEPARAMELANASLRAVPSPNPHGHALAARSLLEMHRALAEGVSVKASRRQARSADHLSSLAVQAESHARRAIASERVAADTGAHMFTMGEAIAVQHRWSEAVTAFEAATQLRPFDAQPHVHAGASWLRLARPDEARVRFRHALEIVGSPGMPVGADAAHGQELLAAKARRGIELAEAMIAGGGDTVLPDTANTGTRTR